ncbi:MAG: endonuclease V [Thermoleophilia bacterium]|nr:endonuclease V [Thermoleophilia bacterium]
MVEVRHDWRVSRDEAAAIQRRLAGRVTLQPLPAEGPGSPRYAAGVDVSYSRDGSRAWAAALVMDRRFKVLASTTAQGTPDSHFEHGYLAFREGRLTLEVLSYLEVEPDLVFLDAHGVVHERGLGMASHVGVVLGLPTIGVPKTPYHPVIQAPGPVRGDYYVLRTERGAEGASIRLKSRVKPVYVSPGHLVDLPSAIALALVWSTGRRRLPEPLAAAHTLSLKARNEARHLLGEHH